MSNDLHPLDGAYRVVTEKIGEAEDGQERRSDGETRIQDSHTQRMDNAWCRWGSVFQVIAPNKVLMTSTADPSQAAPDYRLTKHDGTKTRDPVSYRATLDLKREGESESGALSLSGEIRFGEEAVFLRMERIGD